MAAINAGWRLKKLGVDEPMAGVRSMIGFGLASQVVVGSAASAKSSGEHDSSGVSAVGVVTRGRVCATAEVNQRLRAKQATRTRANGFRSTINEELPFPLEFLLFVSYREEGTAKRPRHISVRSKVVQAAM